MRPGVITNTAIYIEVTAVGIAECPDCHRQLVKRWKLTEESLVTSNTTETAKYAVRSMRAELEAEKRNRGWRELQCGRCADPESDPESDQSSGKAGS